MIFRKFKKAQITLEIRYHSHEKNKNTFFYWTFDFSNWSVASKFSS